MLQTIALMALLTAPQVEAGCKAGAKARIARNHVFATTNVQVQSGVFAVAVPTVAFAPQVAFAQPAVSFAPQVAVQAAPCHVAAAVQQTFAAPQVAFAAVPQVAFTSFAVQPVAALSVFTPTVAVQQVAVAVPVAAVNVNVGSRFHTPVRNFLFGR